MYGGSTKNRTPINKIIMQSEFEKRIQDLKRQQIRNFHSLTYAQHRSILNEIWDCMMKAKEAPKG